MKSEVTKSPMDIVAVLTKVFQDRQKIIQEQQRTTLEQRDIVSVLSKELRKLARGMGR